MQDGEVGELIVTPLTAKASPLLRYQTRDRVQWIAPGSCSCERPLAGIRAGGVQRYDDMIKIKGTNVWPAQFDTAIFSVPGVSNYRGTVELENGRESIRVRVECRHEQSESVIMAVEASVREFIGLKIEVQTIELGQISHEIPEGFVKVPRWIDNRRQDTSNLLNETKKSSTPK